MRTLRPMFICFLLVALAKNASGSKISLRNAEGLMGLCHTLNNPTALQLATLGLSTLTFNQICNFCQNNRIVVLVNSCNSGIKNCNS